MALQDWKHRFSGGATQVGKMFDEPATGSRSPHLLRRLLVLSIVVGLALAALGAYWSRTPAEIAVVDVGANPVPGIATTTMLIRVIDTLLDKPGGYLSNDILPPGAWLDNVPNWEYGVLIQVRDLAKAMREAFSRSQSQSTEDADLAEAEPHFNFDNSSWILPSSEAEYGKGREHLRTYLARLSDDDQNNARFYARADNLRYWLGTLETRLGSLSQRLRASVGQQRINMDLVTAADGDQRKSLPSEILVKTPWAELDDVFYEGRGTSWAILHFLRAVEVDFAEVLKKKNAQASLRQIIRDLEATQTPLGSPVILNGSGFGLVANHSLTMASYISRANAALINLRELLSQG